MKTKITNALLYFVVDETFSSDISLQTEILENIFCGKGRYVNGIIQNIAITKSVFMPYRLLHDIKQLYFMHNTNLLSSRFISLYFMHNTSLLRINSLYFMHNTSLLCINSLYFMHNTSLLCINSLYFIHNTTLLHPETLYRSSNPSPFLKKTFCNISDEYLPIKKQYYSTSTLYNYFFINLKQLKS